MLIYLAVILFCFILAFFKLPKFVENGALILIALFLCFGYMTGTDWFNYEYYYQVLSVSKKNPISFEIGYNTLQVIFSKLGVDFWVFHILMKLLVFYSIISFIRWLDINVFLFLALFLPEIGFYLFIDCPFRNLIAIGIGLIAYRKLFENKKISFFIFVALAMSFHIASSVLIILFFLYKTNIKTSYYLLLIVVVYILAYNVDFLISKIYIPLTKISSILHERLLVYFLNEDFISQKMSFGAIVRLVILAIILLFKDAIISGDEKRKYIFNMVMVFFLLFPLGASMKILHRFTMFISPLYIIALILMLKSLTIKTNRYLLYTFFVLLSMMQTYLVVTEDYRYVPYTNYAHYWIKKDLPDMYYRHDYNIKNSPHKKSSKK